MPAAGGQWSVVAESVNSLIGDLVQPTNEISRVIGAVAKGDLTRAMATEFDYGTLPLAEQAHLFETPRRVGVVGGGKQRFPSLSW